MYEGNNACLFKIKIYRRIGDAKRYVVEFQRRSGDVVAFANFYRDTLAALGPVVERPFATPTLSLPALTCPTGSAVRQPAGAAVAAKMVDPGAGGVGTVAPVVVGSNSNVILDDDTQKCLMDMASSLDSDVQRESVRFLASASSNPVNQLKLMSTPDKVVRVVSLLGILLASKDKEVVRCTAMLTANLARQATVRVALLPLVPQLLHLLDLSVPAGSVNALLFKDVRRQIARIVVALSVTCRTELYKRPGGRTCIVSVLEKHRLSDDSVLRHCATVALANLQVPTNLGVPAAAFVGSDKPRTECVAHVDPTNAEVKAMIRSDD